jgi:tRNA(His) guanylyltransferase
VSEQRVGLPIDDRMKLYEASFHSHLVRRVPVIVRVDGRAFHGVTRSWPSDGPFCAAFMDAMHAAARALADDMEGFRLGYVQSDEASFLLTDFDTPSTNPWFGYDLQKVVSISAATMTRAFAGYVPDGASSGVFDARAFNVPREDAANYFLWRARDWSRNSLQMFARSFFSQKQLHGKDTAAMHEMLHGIGKNWATDLSERTRNGTWLLREGERFDIRPKFVEVDAVIEPLIYPVAPLSGDPQC